MKIMTSKLDLQTYDHDPFVKASNGGSYLVKNFVDEFSDYDSGARAKYQHNSLRVNPQSGLSNIFNSSAQQLDFLFPRCANVCHYDKIDLYLTIQNTGANLATLLASHFMIDYIEVMVSGATVETIYSHHLLYNELYLAEDDESVYNNRALRAFNGGIQGTAYTGPGTLAAGVSRTFFIEIPCVFSRTECFMPAINSDILFRVHFQPTALTSASLATTITLTNADIFISGREYDDVTKQKLIARYKKIDHVMPYYEGIRAIISSQAISAATKSNIKISEFSGSLSSQLVVMLVSAGAVQENLYNFQGTTKLDILRNGLTVSSFQDQPTTWLLQQMAEKFNTTAVSSQNVYVITQSNAPAESVDIGVQRGGIFLTTNDILEIQASINNTYDVYVLCYRFCNATITKTGNFILQPIVF